MVFTGITALPQEAPAPEILPVGKSKDVTANGSLKSGWEAIEKNYVTPSWFTDGKFGLMMHWGIYSVPARQSEWYVRYMYGGNEKIMHDHIAKYGTLDKFGYKDFIPMFTASKWDPDAWAELFRRSGAKYIVPTAEHHDGFSLWTAQ